MGQNICLYRVKDGIATELPDAEWDSCRYGGDYEVSHILAGPDSSTWAKREWIQIAHDEDGYDPGDEPMWRPRDEDIATVARGENERGRRIAELMRSDPSIMMALI